MYPYSPSVPAVPMRSVNVLNYCSNAKYCLCECFICMKKNIGKILITSAVIEVQICFVCLSVSVFVILVNFLSIGVIKE